MKDKLQEFEDRLLKWENDYRDKYLPGSERYNPHLSRLVSIKDIEDFLLSRHGVYGVEVRYNMFFNRDEIIVRTGWMVHYLLMEEMRTILNNLIRVRMIMGTKYQLHILN